MAAFSMADASWELDRPLLILDGIKRATVAGTPRAEAATAQHWGSELTAAAGFTTSPCQIQTFHYASASNPCPPHSSGMDGTSTNRLGNSAPASSPVQSPSPAHGTSVPALFLGDLFMPSYSSSIPQADIPAGLAPPYSLALVQGLPSLCMRQERAEAIVKELQEGLMQATGANQKEVEEKGGGGLFGLLPHFRMPWQQPQEAETKARHAEGGTAGGGASGSLNSAAQAQASTQPSMTVRRLPLLAALKMLQPAHPGGGGRRWPQFHMLTEQADAEAVENAAEEQSFVVDLRGLSDSHMPIEVWEGEEEDAIRSVDTADGKEDGQKDDTKDGISTISMMRFGEAKQMARDANAAALPSAGPSRLTVFRIPGFALMLRTNAGLVSFQPAFLSCYHLHKVLASAIRVYKKGWLMQRQAARDQWRRGIETTAVKLAGNAWLVSQINRSKGAAGSDAEESDDDGEAWGMPAEAAELMEELGEKSGAVQLTLPSGDDFASHVSAVAVGTISVATRAAVWALDALDSAVANTPFGNWVMGIPNYVSVQADYLDDHVLALKLFNEQRLKFLPPPTDPAANTPATSTPLPASTPASAAAISHPKDDMRPSQKSMAYARKKVAQVLAHQLDVRDFEMEADEEDGMCFSSESASTSGRVGGQQEDEANQKPHNNNSHKSAALGDVDYDNYRQATGVHRLQCPDYGQNFRQNNDDHDQSGLHYSFWQAAPSWPELATLKQLKCGGKPALHVVTGCGSLPLLTDSDNLCTGCHGLSFTTHCDNLSLSTGSHDATGGRALYHAACSAAFSASPCRPLPAQTHEQVYERSRQLMHRVMGLLYAEQQSPGFPGSNWKHPAHESHVTAGSGPAHHMPHSTGPARGMAHDAGPAHIMARGIGPACSMIHSTGLAGSMNYSTTTTSCSPRPSPATSSLCTPPSALPSSSPSPSFGTSSLCPLYCSSLNNPTSAILSPTITANHPGGQPFTGFCPTLLAATASNVSDAPVTTSSSPNSASSCSPAPTSILPGGDSAQDVAGDSLQGLAKVTSRPALPIPYLAPSPLHAAICHTFPPILPACNEFSQGGNDHKQDNSQTRFSCCAMPAILNSSSASSAQNLRAGHSGETPGQQINRQSTQQARNGLTHCSTQHSAQQSSQHSAQQSTQQSLGEHANEQASQHSGEPVNKRSWWQFWRHPSQQDSPQAPSINSPHSLPPSQSPPNSKRGTDSTPTHTAVAAETIPLPTNPDQPPIPLTPDHPDVGKRDPPPIESYAAHAQDPLFNCHPGQPGAGAMPPQLAGDVTANAGALLPNFPEQLPATALSPTTLFPTLQPENSKHSSSGGDQNVGLGPGHTSACRPLPPPSHSFLPSTNPQQSSSTNSVDASSTPPCGQGKLGSRGSDIVRDNNSNDDSHSNNSKNSSNSNTSNSNNSSSNNNNSGHGIPDIQSYTSQHSSSHCDSTANQGSNTAASNTGDSRSSGSTNGISNHSSNATNNAANNTGDPQSSSSPNNNSNNNNNSSSNSSPHASGQVSARGSSHRRRNAAVPRLQLESLHGVGSLLRVIWTVWWDMEAGEGRFVERIFKANQYNSANMNAYLGTVLTSLGDKLEVHMRIGITNLGLPLNPQSMLPVPFPSPHATSSPSASRSPMPALHPPAVSNTSPLPATSISFQTTSQKGGMQPHEFDIGLLLDTKRMFAKAEDGGDDVEWNGRVAECGITPARGLLLIGDLGFEQPGYVQELGFADIEELGVRGVKVVCMPDSND